MQPIFENPKGIELSNEFQLILARLFANYRRVIIRKEFYGGFSGGRVLEVQPIKANGTPELPTVVKLATISFIQKEWSAYRQHIHYRLPFVAEIKEEPVLLPETGWGGLRYTLMGGNTFEVVSLRDYCRRADTTAADIRIALERLLKIMRHIWGYSYLNPDFHLRASYDQLLPVNLLIQYLPSLPQERLHQLTPDTLPTAPFAVGDYVRVSGFAVSKVNPITQTMTLNRPNVAPDLPAYTLRCKSSRVEKLTSYQLHQIVDSFEGQVIETRTSRLQDELRRAFGQTFDPTGLTIQMLDQATLPNPLQAIDMILNQQRKVCISSIHGDFNMENILIEPETGMISLIDFAEAREDHVLHDLLRLETEVVTRIIPEILHQHEVSPAQALASLYWQLYCADVQNSTAQPALPHPGLAKAWALLTTIHHTARQYLYKVDDVEEYYQGLMLYLLGALKFKNLNDLPEHPLPKQTAFWTATLIYQLLITSPHQPDIPPPALATLLRIQPQVTLTPAVAEPQPASGSISQAEAERKLLALPLERIPTLAALPPQSRMPLSRNPLFVGRQRNLQLLARALKGGDAIAIRQVETAATTGMGGMGKTQLASEFVHRYGRFFAGGVFWLSFADPKAIPAEIAACGGPGALELRPNFGQLSLEDQVRLVMAAWQEPVPRLLVFDNCEDPELVSRWRPATGGCRVLITSRRLDWEPALGVHSLPLDVLSRPESIALLRQHQPDASDRILNAIAGELGDLPLALHLAGSYLARYRRVISPAQYLTQLRDPNLLQHRSLQDGGMSPTGHVQNVYRTIALSYDRLEPDDATDTLALATLARAACLAPGEPIPYHLLMLTLNLDKDHPDIAIRAADAVTRLVEIGLLRSEADNTVRLHRLIVAFVREVNVGEFELLQEAVAGVIVEEAERINKAGYPARLLAWQPHLRAVAEAAMERGNELGAKLGAALAEHLRQAGAYRDAQLYLERAVIICQQLLGNDHPVTARNLANLGHLFDRLEDLQMAWSCFEQALAIQLKNLDEYHSDTATTLNYMGFLLQNKGELAEARKYHERALRIRESVLGMEHPDTAESRTNLAFIHYIHREWHKARQNLEQVRVVYRRMFGEEHPKTISVLEHLGELMQAQSDLAEAQKIFAQVLEVRRKVLGEEHPETARTLDWLGTTYYNQGNLSKAQECYRQALGIRLIVLGEDHLLTARSWTYLGALSCDMDDLEAARLYYEKALQVFESSLGTDHAQTQAVRQKLNSLRFT